MMKFVAVFLVAAVFAMSVVDGRHHGLVKRDATCVLNGVDRVEDLQKMVMAYVNVRKFNLLAKWTSILKQAFRIYQFDRCAINILNKIRDILLDMEKVDDQCIIDAIEKAGVPLHAALDASKDNLELQCFLQECAASGLDACLVKLGEVVSGELEVPGVVVTVVAPLLQILNDLFADVDECFDEFVASAYEQLRVFYMEYQKCIGIFPRTS